MKRLIDIFDRHASKIKNAVLPAMVSTFAFNVIAKPDLPLMAISLGAGVAASFACAAVLRNNAPNVPFDFSVIRDATVVTTGVLWSAHYTMSLMS